MGCERWRKPLKPHSRNESPHAQPRHNTYVSKRAPMAVASGLRIISQVDPAESLCRIFCQFRNEELGTTASLPSAQHLGSFCFPLGPENVHPKEYGATEEYSFTLTGGDGSHLHGFCRSFLPPRVQSSVARKNTNLRYPQVLCIISPFPWFPFYYKILQVVEALLKQGELLTASPADDLPDASPAALFLSNVLRQCKGRPQLGRVVKVAVPSTEPIDVCPQRRIQSSEARVEPPLQNTGSFIELQIPPDTGNGSWNAGIPLARLLWHLKSGPLMALLQAILLERRILMVAQERDTLSASLHAAAALLYPFRWQHIYLPLLPHNLKDYLSAPMPFLVGVPAPQMLQGLRHLALEDVVYVDLDAGSCTAGGPSGPQLDFALLPWGHQLEAAFKLVYKMLRSPTEFESTPVIGHCMQEYFLKLMGSYRDYVELDQPDVGATGEGADSIPPGTRQHVQDDGYLRAHGFRFDHLSFVANQRRSERARHFLDLLRHSQMYEVFINERLALAAGGFKTSDAFEAKVTFLQNKRGKVLGRFVAQAGAKSVSNLSAVLQRTSTLVKSGVAQIRHGHSPSEDSGRHHGVDDTIVPSYSIDMESPRIKPQSEASASLRRPVPHKGEDPTSFFNHDPDAEEDAPPVASPERYASPTRNVPSRPASPLTVVSPTSTSGRATPPTAHLTSPRATGITKGAEGFDALLNLDGVECVFSNGTASTSRAVDPRASIASSLLDDDSQAAETSAFDLSSWGLGLPSVSEAATSVAEWASSIQALAISFNSSDETRTAEPSPSSAAQAHPQPSYDLRNANSLGTIDPFREFQSPEAVRASSSIRPLVVPDDNGQQSVPSVSPGVPPHPSSAHRRAAENGPPAVARSSCSSPLEDRLSADPFSILDPICKQVTTPPMNLSKSTPTVEERAPGGASLLQWGSETPKPVASGETWSRLGSYEMDAVNAGIQCGGDAKRTPEPDASRASLLDL